VHMDGVDPSSEVEPLQEVGELVERQADEPGWHGQPPLLDVPGAPLAAGEMTGPASQN
jgi:hypothetical protein